MAEDTVKQWLKQNDDGSFTVLCSDPPGKRDKDGVGATHFIEIPALQADNNYTNLPEGAYVQALAGNNVVNQ